MGKSVKCPVRAIAFELRQAAANARKWCEETNVEVRLQITEDGSWFVHSGGACYDVSHHGVWGASEVPVRGRVDSMGMARAMWNEAVDMSVDVASDFPNLRYAR